MTDKKSYYAVIPANVRYDENLPPNAKLLYGEITALCNSEGVCWASNKYFADLYRVTSTTISVWIKALVDGGYIQSQIIYKEGTKEILKRYLEILKDPIKENLNTPIKKNLKENNTYFNNTFNITTEYIDNISDKPTPKQKKTKQFIPPTVEEIRAYCEQRNNNVDPQKFFDYYDAAEWIDSKGEKVKSWKQKVITWENSNKKREQPKQTEQKSSGNIFLDLIQRGEV